MKLPNQVKLLIYKIFLINLRWMHLGGKYFIAIMTFLLNKHVTCSFILCRISFGIDLGCLSSPKTPVRLANELAYIQEKISVRFNHPLWPLTERVNGPHKKMQEACDYIDQFA